MTILFVGNTPADFLADISNAGLTYSTGDAHFDPAYVPNSIGLVNPGNDQGNPFSLVLGAEYTDFWLHFRTLSGRFAFSSSSGVMLSFKDGGETLIGTLDFTSDTVRVQAVGDTTENGAAYRVPSLSSYTVDMHVAVSGGNITVSYYHNGGLISTAVAANIAAKGGVQSVVFENFDTSQDVRTINYSEIICTNAEPTVGWRLASLVPDGVGFHAGFVGDYTDLADGNVATAAGTDTALDKLSSTLSAYGGPASPAAIRAVIAKCVATRGDTGPANMRQFLRIASTDYEGSLQSLATGNAAYMQIWDQNPNTLVDWDTANLAALEVGVKAET